LHYNNKESTEQTDICNEFNNYFSTVRQTLLDQLNSTNTATTTQDFRVFCDKSNKNSMFFSPATCDELYKLIMQLKSNKSPGPAILAQNLIKYVACERVTRCFIYLICHLRKVLFLIN